MPWSAAGKPIVLIRWVDSHSSDGWARDWDDQIVEWERDPDDLIVLTVGWLYKVTDKCHYVFSSQNAHGQMQGLMQIPSAAVRSVDVLREGE